MSRNVLVVFSRLPIPGKAKTRLIPQLGKEEAAEVHRELAEFTFQLTDRFKSNFDVEVKISRHGGTREDFQNWLGEQSSYLEQCDGDLGDKMSHTFQTAFDNGALKVVIIGTDCPELKAETLKDAFSKLATNDLVLGPAKDGGYYLIGLSSFHRELFQNIPWGGKEVFTITLQIADKLKLLRKLLPLLNDIDRPEDLPIWEKIKDSNRPF